MEKKKVLDEYNLSLRDYCSLVLRAWGGGEGGGGVWSGRAIVFQYDNDEAASGRRVSVTK